MNDITFYNEAGNAIAYSEDGEHIFMFNGNAVAYIVNDSIFNYSGEHIGWFEDGWIRDRNGNCVLCSENSQGGPMIPMRSMKPMKSMKEMKPMKGMREMKPMKPMKSLSWSSINGKDFFIK